MNALTMNPPITFDPNAEDTRRLRDAFGKFTTGVTVITCRDAEGPIAITANSFSSISLDPALVMWSISKESRRYPAFANADKFAIHVMSSAQRDIAEGCAKDARFLISLPHGLNVESVPLIPGCLARFECQTSACHEAGDHVIVIGEVARVEMRDGDPLVFSAGDFGGFKRD